jgi:hypothetical protein
MVGEIVLEQHSMKLAVVDGVPHAYHGLDGIESRGETGDGDHCDHGFRQCSVDKSDSLYQGVDLVEVDMEVCVSVHLQSE